MSRMDSTETPSASSNLPNPRMRWVSKHLPWLYSFWKFSRPHTIIGTTLSVLGLFWMAWSLGDRTVPPPLGLTLPALLACLGGNVYIVGLNQLEDVAIDRINKPHLPLAAEEYSRRQAQTIVAIALLIALVLSITQGPYLTATVWISVLIGTAYSLPPIRLKRFPVWASLCIFTVRGVIVNLGLFLHFQQRLGDPARISAPVWALMLFVLVFTFAIAIFKDIPDLEGDRRYHIRTFTLRLGARAVFNLARWVLTACYLGMILAALVLPQVNTIVLVLSQGLALAAVWLQSRSVDLQDRGAIARFYQFIWKLFFLEYLLFPLACWLGS